MERQREREDRGGKNVLDFLPHLRGVALRTLAAFLPERRGGERGRRKAFFSGGGRLARGQPFGKNGWRAIAHPGIEKAALTGQFLLLSGQSKVRAIAPPSRQNTQPKKG